MDVNTILKRVPVNDFGDGAHSPHIEVDVGFFKVWYYTTEKGDRTCVQSKYSPSLHMVFYGAVKFTEEEIVRQMTVREFICCTEAAFQRGVVEGRRRLAGEIRRRMGIEE